MIDGGENIGTGLSCRHDAPPELGQPGGMNSVVHP